MSSLQHTMLPSALTEQLGARIPATIIWARKSSASSRPEGWVSEFVRLCNIETQEIACVLAYHGGGGDCARWNASRVWCPLILLLLPPGVCVCVCARARVRTCAFK